MIWGKTFDEQHAKQERKDARVGTVKRKFTWLPDILPNGRWVWLQWCNYQLEKETDPECYIIFQYSWKLIEVVT